MAARGGINIAISHHNMSHTKPIRTIFQAFLLILAQLTTAAPPAILSVVPPPGALGELREITVTFTKPVAGIEFSDLLLNEIGRASCRERV